MKKTTRKISAISKLAVAVSVLGVFTGSAYAYAPNQAFLDAAKTFSGSAYAVVEGQLDSGMLVSWTGTSQRSKDVPDGDVAYNAKVTSEKNSQAVVGAYQSVLISNAAQSGSNPSLITISGSADVWVVEAGKNLGVGDFLISSDVAGHAMVNPGSLSVAHIVARSTEPVDWSKVSETVDVNGAKRKHKKVPVFITQFDMNEPSVVGLGAPVTTTAARSDQNTAYPLPDVAVPPTGGVASGGVAAQIQGAGTGAAVTLGPANGKLTSDAKSGVAFELKTKNDFKDGKLLSLVNVDKEKFAIDKDGKIVTQSVGTGALEDRAVTSAKLKPSEIQCVDGEGDNAQTTSADYVDVDGTTGCNYTAGATDETLILNGRLMGQNAGGAGLAVRIATVIDGKTTGCTEAFSDDATWSTLATPCSVRVPAKTTVQIKWQYKVRGGGTAVVHRRNKAEAPFINGFAIAR